MRLLLITLAVCCFQFVHAQSEETTKPKITFLGTFHFGGTTDMAAITMDSVLGERRQKEIKDLVKRLQAFAPTKVMLEYRIQQKDTLQKRYEAYLDGQFDLPKSETYQVGFRLAKAMGHKKVHAIDYKMDLPFDALMKYCQENGQMDKMQGIMQTVTGYTAGETEVLKTMELSEFMIRMNNDEMDRFGNRLYLQDMANIGDSDNEAGAAVGARWYHRNMIMLKNVLQNIEQSEERVLVIVGASHRAVMKELLANLDEYEYVEVSQFLK